MAVSARHGLTKEELTFCRVYSSFGRANPAEAYRRSFLIKRGLEYWEPAEDGGPPNFEHGAPMPSRTASKKAAAVLKLPHVKAYLDELENPAGDTARESLVDTLRFGDPAQAARASQRILDDEDKLGFRIPVERHAEILSAIGAEVNVALPDGGRAVFDLREMFPAYSEALPPPEVLLKTMQSLDQYLWVLMRQADGTARPDPRDWRFLDGQRAYFNSQPQG